MEFKFDANQAYQVRAVEAVADLFDGQAHIEAGDTFGLVANRLDLDDDALLENLNAVQAANGVAPDPALACIEQAIQTGDGESVARFPNYSVEMETGTGKTYVYLRTALELHRRYGFRKYIIVVPSVAIREGVLKTLRITEKHFKELYDNVAYRYSVYDSEKINTVWQFALADSVEFLIMTIDSFNKASNVFRQSTDRLMGETPIHLVQQVRPILILDEPQNMESEKSVAALAALDPLVALRYSATHRNPYNLIYRLTPVDAYRQRLVKRIEVAGVLEQDDLNQAYVRIEQFQPTRSSVNARVAIHKLMKDGSIKEQVVTLHPQDSLEDLAGRPEYAGYIAEEISIESGLIRFMNGVEVYQGVALSPNREDLFRAQIRDTIEEHFRKQAQPAYRDAGIKVLSLFFIDRVDNYASDDGIIRRLFVEAFDELKQKPQYAAWRDVPADAVRKGYFAQKRIRGETELLDSVSGKTEADREAYDLIMRDKERLLSFDEPVAFIFSHSALREGWDNPNVFQICTLNQTTSEVKKRQEIGRGMRLPVNTSGERVREDKVNILTVIANESYERYVARLQAEIVADFGEEEAKQLPKPGNARDRGKDTARRVAARFESPEFKELWERIRRKTRYSVSVDTGRLIDEVVAGIDAIQVRSPRITIAKGRVDVDASGDLFAQRMTADKAVATLEGRRPMPNLVEIIQNLMERTTPPVRITRKTLVAILARTSNFTAARKNPQEFATQAMRIIKEKLADHLVAGIQYEPLDEWYEMSLFEEEVASLRELLEATKSIYDKVACDSDVERRFLLGLNDHACVKLFVKLPPKFKVDTPIGDYNPDWAIVWEDANAQGDPTGDVLYLVRETKFTTDPTELDADERRKVICGSHHFNSALGTDYRVVKDIRELPDGGWQPR